MDLSVLIPTYRRPDKLRRCLESLAVQQTRARFEIIVGVDGGEGAIPAHEIPDSIRAAVRLVHYPKLGYIAVRRRMLHEVRGRLFLSLNDDVHAAPDLLQCHIECHDRELCVVAGSAAWKPVESPTLFDQIVQHTNLIFFHPPTDRPPTYRDCYGLNMSAPTAFAREHGGFPDVQDVYGYDDIELAHRLTRRGAALRLEPAAGVVHDHRYTPEEVLKREYLLGRSAWVYAGCNPEFARELFGRDIQSRSEIDHAERSLEREARDAIRVQSRFLALAQAEPLPTHPSTETVLASLADSWLLLKRFLWRKGLLAASRGEPCAWSLLR
ncbi:MAG TPA: glycosyltransferase [Phycisphaerales bacterium]